MSSMKPITRKKLAIMILIMIIAIFIFSIVAEAAFKDTVRNSWGKTKGGQVLDKLCPCVRSIVHTIQRIPER